MRILKRQFLLSSFLTCERMMIIRLFPPPPSFSLLLSPSFYIFLFLFFFHRFPTTEKHEQKDGFRHGMNPYKLARERERGRKKDRRNVVSQSSEVHRIETMTTRITFCYCYFVTLLLCATRST